MHAALRNRLVTGLILIFLAAHLGCGGGGSSTLTDSGNVPPPGGGVPVATAPANDTFNWTGNTRLTVIAARGLLANDPAGTVIASADTVTSKGGTVNVNLATGAFTYAPPLGLQNIADTFTYTVAGFAPLTVTINLAERVWYVRNDDTGTNQGNDRAPFLTLAQAQNASDDNDTIFVFAGDLTAAGQNTGITLKPGQRLIGEGVGLKFNGVPIVDPVPEAVISNAGLPLPAGNIPVITLATGNEVAGFAIEAAFNEGILAPGGTGHNLHNNIVTFDPANGREGVRLLNVTGNNAVTTNTITGSPRSGIKFVNNEDQAGNIIAATPITATVAMGTNTITGSAQDGIRVTLDGAGTDVKVSVLTNTISNSGTAGANQGIDIGSLGAARITAVVSRNTVSGSTAQAADLTANGPSSLAAFVANNVLSGSAAGVTDFRNAIAAGGTATSCLELVGNVNAAVPPNSTFRVENNPGIAGAFQLFESANDSPAVRVGPIADVARGACGIVLPGAALFEANCGICHIGNGLGHGTAGPNITNRPAALITLQLSINPSMNNIRLTPEEVQAIAAALVAIP